MAIDGVVAGEGSSPPADAVVGSALLALRSDLCEFKGWVITLQDGNGDNPSKDVHTVTISGVDADGEDRLTTLQKAGTQ